jgi:ElaB/YqjD/DUF883 family membrane-anchored ribosome-binding protein
MKLDLKTWIILGLLILLVGYILFDKPAEKTDLEPYKIEKAILTQELREQRQHAQDIIKKAKERTTRDSIAINAKDKRIAVLEIKARQARTPKVDTLILNNPDLELFVNTQDSIIQVKQELIDTLKSALDFQIQVKEDLVQNHEAEARISKRIEGEQDKVIAKLEKAVKKKTNGNKFWKSVAVAGTVGAFILGSGL